MSKNASDLISRKAVCDMLHEEMGAWGNCADEIEALLKANDALWEIPAVDAVEVVRCKDCKHRRNDEDYASGHYCVKRPSNGGYFCEDNDFCSYGERKGDDA